jgi:hypothetical protein
MSYSKLCFTEWLRERLNGGFIAGLQWVNKELGIFSVPWKHKKRRDFEDFIDGRAAIVGVYCEVLYIL